MPSLSNLFLISADGKPQALSYDTLPVLPSPSDDNVKAGPGDDLSPPNSLKAGKCNSVTTHFMANAGFSGSGKRKRPMIPSSTGYELFVKKKAGDDTFGLEVCVALEFANPNPGESMVVWLKKLKQFITDEKLADQELVLIDSKVQDWVGSEPGGEQKEHSGASEDGGWVTITTDIHYAAAAEAVTQAVIESGRRQTAVRVMSSGESDDAKLGPIGPRGRLLLTYACEQLYSYAQMALPGDHPSAGERLLVPLSVHLPWAPLGDQVGKMGVSVALTAPHGSTCLNPTAAVPTEDGTASPHMLAHTTLTSALPVLGEWEWACSKCTLRNPGTSRSCGVCDDRPDPESRTKLPKEGAAGMNVLLAQLDCGNSNSMDAADPVEGGKPTFVQSWPCLPPTPWCVFFWLSLSPSESEEEEEEGWEVVLPPTSSAPPPYVSLPVAALTVPEGGRLPDAPPPIPALEVSDTGAAAAAVTAAVAEAAAPTKQPSVGASDPAPPGPTVSLLWPCTTQDAALMRVSPPGSGGGDSGALLLRARVNTGGRAPVDTNVARALVHLNISDASGSTGMRNLAFRVTGGGTAMQTVRANLNALAEVRLLRRLTLAPQLIRQGLLREGDVWVELAYIFDSQVTERLQFECPVSALADGRLVRAAAASANGKPVVAALDGATAETRELWKKLAQFLVALRGIRPGGATAFAEPAKAAKEDWSALERRVRALTTASEVRYTTYVNFDTDGGNNSGGECYSALRDMGLACSVRGGTVMGFGSWVDQDCATRVARLLKGPCLLNLEIPEDGTPGCDRMFKKDIQQWLRAVRCQPVRILAHAQDISWAARHGVRRENGCELLGVSVQDEGAGEVRFGAPDVSLSTLYSASVLNGLNAGDTFMAYMLLRLPPATAVQLSSSLLRGDPDALGPVQAWLADRLVVEVAGQTAVVSVQPEDKQGVFLGHQWLRTLSPGGGAKMNTSVLCPRLRQRLQDDLSFSWNLATPCGSTALMGRAATDEKRSPVAPSNQPDEPSFAIAVGGPFDMFAFQAAAPSPSRRPFRSGFNFVAFGAPATPAAGSITFGAAAPTTPATAAFCAAKPRPQVEMKMAERSMSDDEDECAGGVDGSEGSPCTIAGPSEILLFSNGLCVSSTATPMDVNGKLRLVLVESIRAALVRARVGDSGMVWGCNSCNALVPSGATLYHCWECDDYDLCTSCHTTGQSKAPHTASHMTEERVVLPDGNVQPAGMQTTAQGDTSKDKQAQEEAVALLQTFCLSASTWLSFIPCTSDTATLLRSGPTLEGAALLGLAQRLLTAMERI